MNFTFSLKYKCPFENNINVKTKNKEDYIINMHMVRHGEKQGKDIEFEDQI